MPSDRNELVAFVIESSQTLPVARRVRVLRGLAGIIGSEGESAALLEIIDVIKAAEARFQTFALEFNQSKDINL